MQENAVHEEAETSRRSILGNIQSPFPLANNNNNSVIHLTPGIPKAVTWDDASPSDSPIAADTSDDSKSLPDNTLPADTLPWAMADLNTTIDVDGRESILLSPVSRGVFDDTFATIKRHPTVLNASDMDDDNDDDEYNDDTGVLKDANPDTVFRQNSTDIALDESQAAHDTIQNLGHSTTRILERNDTLVREIRFAESTFVEVSARAELLSSQVATLRAEKEELRSEKQSLQETVQSLTTLLQQSHDERTAMDTTLSIKTNTLESQLQASQQTASEQASQIQDLQDQLKQAKLQLQQQFNSSEETIAQLRRHLDEEIAAKTDLESKLASHTRTSKANMERLFDTAKKQLDQLNESVESKQSLLTARLDHSQAHLQFLSTQLEFEDESPASNPSDNNNKNDDDEPSNQRWVEPQSGATTPSHTLSSIPTEAVLSNRSGSTLEALMTNDKEQPSPSIRNESTSYSIPTQSLDLTATPSNSQPQQQQQSTDTLEGFEGYSLLSPTSESASSSSASSSQHSSDPFKQTSDFDQHIEWMASPTPFLQHVHPAAAATTTMDGVDSVTSASDLTGSEGGVSFLEHELQTVRKLLEETKQERDALSSQIESMALTEIQNGSKNHSDLHERLQTLHEEKQRLERNLSDKSQALETALSQLAEMKAAAITNDATQRLQANLEEAQKENRTLQERLTVVSQRLDDTERLLADARTENKQIKDTLSTKSHSLDDLRRNLDLVQAEKDALSLKVDVRTKDCRDLQKGIAYYQAPSTDCKGVKRKSRFKPWKRKDSKLRIKTPRKVILSPDPKSPGSYESQALLDRIAGLENEIRNLTACQSTAQDIGKDLVKTKGALEAVSLERDDLRQSMDNLRQTFGSDLEKVQEAYERLQESHEALEERLSSETAALLDAQKENDRLVSDLESAIEQGTNNAELVAKYRQELREFQNQLNACHDKIALYEEELRVTRESHEAEKKQLVDRAVESKNEYDRLMSDCESLRQQLRCPEKENTPNAVPNVPSLEPPRKSPTDGVQLSNNTGDVRRAEQYFRQGQRSLMASKGHAAPLLQLLEGLVYRNDGIMRRRYPNEFQTSHDRAEISEALEGLERMRRIESELSKLEKLLQMGTVEAVSLRERNESLALKCGRLKDYIRKLTTKCDEWELFHQRQAEFLRQLKIANDGTRQKALELAQRYEQSDLMYTVEKQKVSTLQNATGQLESELDEIAGELSTIRVFPPTDSSSTNINKN